MDNFLDAALLSVEENHRISAKATNDEEAAQADFLRLFRNCAESDILPFLRSVEQDYKNRLSNIEIKNHLNGPVSTVSISFDIQKIHYDLSIYANLRKRKVFVNGRIGRENKFDKDFGLNELTPELVKRKLSDLVEAGLRRE